MRNYEPNERILVNVFGLNAYALPTFVPATVRNTESLTNGVLVELDKPLDKTKIFIIRDLSRIKRPISKH